MKPKIKSILENSFYQLLAVYTVLVLLASLNLFWKYTLHFEIFAVILAILGIVILSKPTETPQNNKSHNLKSFYKLVLTPEQALDTEPLLPQSKLWGITINKLPKIVHYILFTLAILLILLFRVIPYLGNSIPLGYDAGIYKSGIEQFKLNGFNADNWVKSGMSPLFLYIMLPLSFIFSSEFILTYLFILACLFLGMSIYYFAKEYFNEKIALISILLYAVSIIQFKVFALMYYKNIIALSLLLLSLIFYKKENRALFIIFSVLTAAMHLPTFYIFFLAYVALCIKEYKKWKTNLMNIIIILFASALFYIGFYKQAVLPLIMPVAQSFIQPGTASGTFLSFFQYQFSTLAYLPFAILGFFSLVKSRKFDMIFFLTLITGIIVYFQFFFFNRFIIHLDIFLIILASVGFYILIQNKKKLGVIILIIMLFSASFVALNEARTAKPIISKEQFNLIQEFQNVEQNASVLVLSSEYSPYILAYSNRKTIAPGLFDENKWTKEQWQSFWKTQDKEETKELMSVYNKPIYLFAGNKEFNNPCFSVYLEENSNKILKYTC